MTGPLPRTDLAIARAIAALEADDRERWEERAAIREYDGRQTRRVAEREALWEILERQGGQHE